MKIIKLSILALTLGLMSFSVNPVKTAETVKTIVGSPVQWKAETVELGEIPQGKPVKIDFEFKNTGKTAVIITNVKASCGCTATDYTKSPVAPNETAKITATFNAAAKGVFTKTVTVTTNAEEAPKVLVFKGTVI
ncbi:MULTISPECIES: DUF1573 domain-containing protein [Flavobacterium]|uniref:DUF1573 domain-containing protein n=1 Tax=Flavobacterium TaxID=237 RepID=UPI00086EEEC1|nr:MULTISPECIES: DUF1573 domain-containing protein [Flavobacterium]MBN9283117.1 DUF1573 domain-containing protein [Flavobacterium sp.]ODS86622.1 MAG: hypothetical protein ABS44_13000 [Chryseobacterium sp. SCN 40-13]OJV67746.1 MAG: hypothetical protein BGO42_17120 [Flavobacterium sp. 40-81]